MAETLVSNGGFSCAVQCSAYKTLSVNSSHCCPTGLVVLLFLPLLNELQFVVFRAVYERTLHETYTYMYIPYGKDQQRFGRHQVKNIYLWRRPNFFRV